MQRVKKGTLRGDKFSQKIDIPFKLEGAFRDENQPQVKAVREALVNLLCAF